MEQDKKVQTRKKFIGLGIGSAALLACSRFFSSAKTKKTQTVKMLTQEGKLVEVDIERLSVRREKIDDEQLKTWVKK